MICYKLHEIFNNKERFFYQDIGNIPFNNGVYIIFENNEKYHDFDRIVRIGTHTSENRLKERLKDHFIKKNKNRSIFRKNIGKALLNKSKDPYLEIWSANTSNKTASINKYGDLLDFSYEKEIEEKVSDYMKANLSFTCFEVKTEAERLFWEKAIIATLSHEEDFSASENWLGNYSPEIEISTSGLWLKKGLDEKPLDEISFSKLKMIL